MVKAHSQQAHFAFSGAARFFLASERRSAFEPRRIEMK
jgi:hypothetical protein